MKNKIAIVTGASRGLGAAIAESLSYEGFSVAICSRKKEEIESECKRIKTPCLCDAVDAGNEADVKRFVSAVVKKFGKIDVLVNNAGVVHKKLPIEDISSSDFKSSMNANVDSVFFFMKEVVPLMKKSNQGIIVNVSSGAGKRGHPGLSVYSASKFAVQGFTESVAKELEQTGVKCIAVLPGGINTGMRSFLFGKEDAERQQSPASVAEIIKGIVIGKTEIKNGSSVHIRQGKITEINELLVSDKNKP